jgi:hypothetical protein
MYIMSYAIMQVLTKIQKLLPDSRTRESDQKEAQLHDDKTLLEEMKTQIKDVVLNDQNEYVSMCHGLFCYRSCSQVPHLRKCH